MPVHLTTRRHFITQVGASVVLSGARLHSSEVDENLVAVLNDTHIGEQHSESASIPANLRRTVAALLALPRRPAAVIINGDLALKDGRRGDYEHLVRLIEPLHEAGVALHLGMGNHDDREIFYEVLQHEKPAAPVVESKHVSLVRLGGASLFLLDSLKATMVTQGLLGGEQLQWLTKLLDLHNDKPALVFAHHNPRLGGDPLHFPGGLEDSEPLWRVLAPRRHVKAYIHGHIHHREFHSHEGIHILNTPATSYVADKKTSTTGWTLLRLDEQGAQATTLTHQPDHPWNNAVTDLAWRT